jgi:nucleoside-diphosphate-sugar epimerase
MFDSTKHLLDVCKEKGITSFVYTSTHNVVFEGEPIEMVRSDLFIQVTHQKGDESMDYPVQQADYYAKWKSEAEKLVLKHNKTPVAQNQILYTCSIRPGITRHFLFIR